jgi:cystathionine beta-lyase
VVAAVAAYDSGQAWLDEVLGYLDGNRRVLAELLAEHLPRVGYVPPEGTYLAWLDCRELGLPAPAESFRERAGVAVVDGAECGEAGRGHIRFNFATPLPVLREAITRMARV